MDSGLPRETDSIDHDALNADLRAVCEHHGLTPGPAESIYGWVTVIAIEGHEPDGREYRRYVSVASQGLTGGDVLQLWSAKMRQLITRRRSPRRSSV